MKILPILILTLLFSANCKKGENKTSETPASNSPVVEEPKEKVPEHEELKNKRQYVSADVLKVRVEPNLKAESTATLVMGDFPAIIEENVGEVITVNGISANWAKIKYDTVEGYVFAGYLTDSAPDLLTEKEKAQVQKEYDNAVAYNIKAEEKRAADEQKARDELEKSRPKWRRENKSKYKTEEELNKAEEEWFNTESQNIFSKYQSCSPSECGLMTVEMQNINKGCNPTKFKILKQIFNDVGSQVKDKMTIINAFGDDYCIKSYLDYNTQCPATTINWSF